MNGFTFELQRFAWSQVSDESWLYTSGSSSFYLNGTFDAEEDDNGNIGPQNVTVSGANATIEPDWTESISIVGGSFKFVDEYESFEASLTGGDQALNDNSEWTISGAGYVYHSYNYFDSDLRVVDLEDAPRGRMTLSLTSGSNGFSRVTVNVNGATTSEYTTFNVTGIPFKRVSNSGNSYTIIPNILRISLTSSGLTYIANDFDETEITARTLEGIYGIYDSTTQVVTLVNQAAYFDDSTTLDIEVEGVSSGLKVVGDSFVAFAANESTVSINTDDPPSYNIDGGSWIWDSSTRTILFDVNMELTGVSNVTGSTTLTWTDEQIIITGAVLTNAAIDDTTIEGTDNNPSNGYVINIIDNGMSYEFADDSSTAAPTVASITYNANGSFTFVDTTGSTVAYSQASVDFTTLAGAIILGESSPLEITISSARNGLTIFDEAAVNSNIVAQLNNGDVFENDHIAADANEINAWALFQDGDVALGLGEATIAGLSVTSTTSIVKTGDLISISDATLTNGSINGSAIEGTDDDPSDGYQITLSGGTASFVASEDTVEPQPTVEHGDLVSIAYDGSFTFSDAAGNSIAYSEVSSLVSTASGGVITLSSAAPSTLTITSSVDGLYIFNGSELVANINRGDNFSDGSIISDSAPTDAWLANGSALTIGDATISGIDVGTSTKVLSTGTLITIQGATLESASINGSAIEGTDDDPSDGYQITLSGGTASFLGSDDTVEPQPTVEPEPTLSPEALASIEYDGAFNFYNGAGETLAYSEAVSLAVTGYGGLITLTSAAPSAITITSSVDGLNIFRDTVLSARINSGDAYSSGAIITDASPNDAWTVRDNNLILGTTTISGITVDTTTRVVSTDDLITIRGATLESASINGSAIEGTDDDPSDGYQITLGTDGWRFVENIFNPWTSLEGGFEFASGTTVFTLTGSNVVDSDQNGRPDNISVELESIDAVGLYAIVDGLNGEVSLNGNSLGILGDTSYTVGLILDGNTFIADSFSNISGGSTIYADGAFITTDGDGALTFGNGSFTINDAEITIGNSSGVVLSLADSTIQGVNNLADGGMINGVGDASVTLRGSATVNGVAYSTNDPNTIVVSGSTVDGLDNNSMLVITPTGTYVVNSTEVEITSDTAIYAIDSTLASIGNRAELRARSVFDVPDETEFVSATQVRETLDATGASSIGGSDFRGNKIVELNERAGNVDADFSHVSGQKFVVIDGGGEQTVEFNNVSMQGALIESNASGGKTLDGGDGGNIFVNESTRAEVSIKGGEGADSIVAAGGHNEVIDLSEGGADTVNAPSGASIRGYDPMSGAAFSTPISKANLIAAIENDSLTFGRGSFNVNDSGEVAIEGSTVSTAINLLDGSGESTRVVFTALDSVTVGLDDASIDQLLYGDLAELTLLGGVGNDTILVGEGSYVHGGRGNDLIKVRAEDTDRGNSIALSEGEDSVEVFNPGWDSVTSDRLIVDSNATITYAFHDNDLHVSSSGGSMVITSVKSDSATKIFTSTAVDQTPTRTVLIDQGTIYEVSDAASRADQYIGLSERTGLDMSGDASNETIDLNGSSYQNIDHVTLGSGRSSIVGTSDAETIVAGAGGSTISSGDGDDLLIASTVENKLEGSTFVYTAGLDTLENYEAVGSATADEIVFNARFTTVEAFGNEVVLEAGSVDQLTIIDGVNKKIRVNGGVFEVGDRLTYDSDVMGYLGTGSATLSLGSAGGNIWLNGWTGDWFDGIRVVDASSSTADSTLVGGSGVDNVLVGGSGNNSLWGSSGGNDQLRGGSGYNEYYYLSGDGSDTIVGGSDGDLVRLLNIGYEDVSGLRVTDSEIGLEFNDGGSLVVSNTRAMRFELSDGVRWRAERSTGSWSAE